MGKCLVNCFAQGSRLQSGILFIEEKKRTKKRQEITLQQLYSGYVKFSWGQYTGKAPGKERAGNVCLKEGLNGGGGFYGYWLKFWLFYGYRLMFFSYG